jgi:hypothetical protein
MKNLTLLKASVLLLPLAICYSPASAQTVTWDNGGGDSLWSTATNWDTDAVPTNSDTAVINLDGANVESTGASNAAEFLQVGSNSSGVSTLNLSSGQITVGRDTDIGFGGDGTASNNGEGVFNHTGGTFVNNSAAARFRVANSANNNYVAGTYNFGGTTLAGQPVFVNNLNDTIIGSGNRKTGTMTMTGFGDFDAVQLDIAGSQSNGTWNITGGNLNIDVGADGLTFNTSTTDREGATLNATIDGTGFSTINVAGTTTLWDGTGSSFGSLFNLSIGSGYTHSVGSTFTIIASSAFAGDGEFTNVTDGQIISAGGFDFEADYTAGDFTLTAIPEPQFASVLLSASALALVLAARRRSRS